MANKFFVTSFLLLLFWMMAVHCFETTTTTTSLSEADDDEIFNETMTEIVMMTEEVDNLINLLSSGTISDEGNVRLPIMIPFAIAGLVVAVTTCATLISTSVYNIWYRNEQLDEAALQQRIKEDERFKALMTENEKLLFEVTRIADGVHSTAIEIVAKLDQIIQTVIQQDFATKIQEPMNILMNAYETHIKTLAKQALLDLNVTCQKYIPQDIIAVMKVKTTEMYKQQLKESIFDEGYDLIARLEDGYLVQYGLLYPFCTMLSKFDDSFNNTINQTTNEIKQIVNSTLLRAMEPRTFANEERNKQLWLNGSNPFWDIYLGDDERSVIFSAPSNDARAKNIYDFLVYNFNSLREPISGSNYTYLVIATTHLVITSSDHVVNMNINSTVNYNHYFYKPPLGTIFIYAQEKFEYPAPECDFVPNENGTLSPQLNDEVCKKLEVNQKEGIEEFMQKHCKYSSLISHTIRCSPGTPFGSSCTSVSYKGSQNFNVIRLKCRFSLNGEDDLNVIFYS